jgi:hypothetical protein
MPTGRQTAAKKNLNKNRNKQKVVSPISSSGKKEAEVDGSEPDEF